MGEYCDSVVRFHVTATATSPMGWISERGRYSRHPYRITEPILPPTTDVEPILTHVTISVRNHLPEDQSVLEALDGFKPDRLAARFKMLKKFNNLMVSTIGFVDLALTARPWSVASLVSSCRHLIFSEIKLELWEAALERTAIDSASMDLVLSRSLAARHRGTSRPDTEAKYSIFSQAFR